MPLLDLTEREDSTFEAIPGGKYHVRVKDAEMRETSGKGALPKGTPMISLQLQVVKPLFETEDKLENRVVFRQLVIPPKEINKKPYEHYKMMNGMLFRALEAVGYSEEELASNSFDLDVEDLVDRECEATVRRYEWTNPDDPEDKRMQNEVTGMRPLREGAASSAIL
jgi:Protein of unknown function (DUF669)